MKYWRDVCMFAVFAVIIIATTIAIAFDDTPTREEIIQRRKRWNREARMAEFLAEDFRTFEIYMYSYDDEKRARSLDAGLELLERLQRMGAENVDCGELHGVVRYCLIESKDSESGSFYLQEAYPWWLNADGSDKRSRP